MNISAISLSLTRPGAVPLSLEQQVAKLFAAGEQGAWYDPSDYATMFNESSGVTPITTVEQPVGLILDKRKGLALGAELNDGLGDAGNWTALGTNTVSESGDEITITYVDNAAGATAAFSAAAGLSTNLTVNAWYKVTGEAKVNTGSVTVRISASTTFDSAAITSTSFVPFTIYFPASNATTNTLTFTGMGSGETITVRNISVKLLDGNHAYQTTSAARPVLRSRYNLLTYSEQFDNAAWSKLGSVTVTANAEVAPDGTTTAEKLIPPASSGTPYIRQDITIGTNVVVRSCYAKAAGYDYLILQNDNSSGFAVFNLSSGQPVSAGTGITATMQSVGNGWYRCSAAYSSGSSGQGTRMAIGISPDGVISSVTTSYTGDGISGIYLWGAQLNLGSTAMSYQRIAAAPTVSSTPTYATTSTMGGEVFRPYLWFDGGDTLVTASIDMSGTDEVTLSAGIRKLSDAAQGAVLEFSSSANNAGAFGLICPVSTGSNDNITFRSTGTSAIVDAAKTGYPAPTSLLVTTGLADVSANLCQLRINGALATSTTTTQGATNYLNAAMYIGSRNAGSTFYNGYLYCMVVRGKLSSAGELASLESYIAGKTGVTL